jgi:TrmH family RNA methyltransferase
MDEPMIKSKDNEKLKLIRKLAERKHRDRERLFVAEGEDLVAAAEAARIAPVFVLRAGEDVAPELLDAVSALGSGTRVIGVYPQAWADSAAAPATYLHGVGDPGNVGAVIRTADALIGGAVVLGPGCADPYSPKAVRGSMGSIFAAPLVRATVEATPAPRVALVAHGGEEPGNAGGVGTLCLGAEREGLPPEVLEACERRWTIPLRAGSAESLNVAAAAAIALGRISSATRAAASGGQS